MGSRGFPGFWANFPGSGINFENLGFGIYFENLGLRINFENLGFGINFENLGFGIGIWDWFRKSGIWNWDLGFIYKKFGILDPGMPDCRPLLLRNVSHGGLQLVRIL